MWGVYGQETRWGTYIGTSSAGAEGLMQFIRSTAAEYHYPYTNYPTPAQSQQQFTAAGLLLRDLVNKHGSWDAALEAYSGHGYGAARIMQLGGGSDEPPGEPTPPTRVTRQYWHPLAFATANPRRVDQGCDFNYCKGYLVAIADGQIKYWYPHAWAPYGGFLVYEITQPGALQGVWVYYAESVTPVVHEGEQVRGGSRVANLTYNESPGIEIGYAEPAPGGKSWAAEHGGWDNTLDNEDAATASGVAFNQLLTALGGPSSIIEGPIVGERPPWASLAVEAVKRNHAGIPSPVAATLTNPSTDTAIVRDDSYAGTVTAVWSALDSAFHDAWVIARDIHGQLSDIKFIGG